MDNRIEKLRQYLDDRINSKKRGELRFVARHMFSVSNFAAMIAIKRGLNPETATIIGLLHDIHTVLTDDSASHAEQSSIKAREILSDLGIAFGEELNTICVAIKNHSLKKLTNDEYSELIKDADVLSHYFFNITLQVEEDEKARLAKLMTEFGLII